MISGLSQVVGPKWHGNCWKKQILKSPGQYFKKFIRKQEKSRLLQKSSVRKRLFAPSMTNKPDEHYGPAASDPLDIDEQELKKQCSHRLEEFQKSPQEIASIELATVGQHDNDLYNTYRCDRLTASKFGMVSVTHSLHT